MRKGWITCLVLVFGNYLLAGQELPGLSYCLLFDSELEKRAFQKNETACDPLIFLLSYDPRIDSVKYAKVKDDLSAFMNKLEEKKRKYSNDVKFLAHVFYKVHREYLKDYKRSGTFNGIFNEGAYNCVTGTALYAFLLNQLGYLPEIYETRYHMFLVVTLSDSSRLLFETTDPVQGFVANREKVDERIEDYLVGEKQTLTQQQTLSAPFNGDTVFKNISMKELAGLHYYNVGVELINEGNYFDAFRALKKASMLYPSSQRIKDFLSLTRGKYDSQLSAAFVTH